MTGSLSMVYSLLPDFGYACEVGANDGLFLSNTIDLESKGWYVLCIEPNPGLREAGAANRLLWRSVACAAEDAEDQPFYAIGAKPWASSSALHLSPPHIAMASGETTEHRVTVRRLDRVLEEAGFPRLDFLSIDVEGGERDVLAGFTIERWKPKALVIESLDDTLPTPEGYELIGRVEWDNIYKRSE